MRIILELNPGIQPISGTFTRPAVQDTVAFRGTLELLALLEATVTDVPSHTETRDEPG